MDKGKDVLGLITSRLESHTYKKAFGRYIINIPADIEVNRRLKRLRMSLD
jgi:hypothetical protein